MGKDDGVTDPLRNALTVSWATIGWSTVTGIGAVVLGLSAASLALVGSGASVLVDVSSSLVLVWRFRHPFGNEAAEHRAQAVAASALVVLAVLLGASSTQRLVTGGEAHPTAATVVLAAASLVVLPLLAARKYAVAPTVPSRALRTDAHITLVGASTAGLALLGFALTERGAGWADPAAALTVALLALVVGVLELRS
jgi:divalent metal cation (Fe/Co/Zn/Cd) transporter